MDNLKVVLPALIALIGTLIVAFLGYRQWKRQHALTRAGSLLANRQEAYRSIWNKLEDVNLSVRFEAFSPERFREAVRSVNVELMKSRLLLKGDDELLVHEYLRALQRFGEKLAEIDHEEHADDVERIGDTFEPSKEAVEITRAYRHLMESRETVIKSFQHAIGADDI